MIVVQMSTMLCTLSTWFLAQVSPIFSLISDSKMSIHCLALLLA